MTEYFLPRHVHFCYRGDAVIFLDLSQDDYVMVSGNMVTALRAVAAERLAVRPESASVLRELLDNGLLTTDRNAGKNVCPTKIELALEHLLGLEAPREIHMTPQNVLRFSIACVTAAARLQWQRLEDIVNAVERRKAKHGSGNPLNTLKARELTAIFHRLRSLFPRNYLCLYDSLALIEFLAQYQIFPTWVFGVKLEPWSAHCWIQEGQFIFNEGVEEAAGYTPVMAI